MDKKRKAGRLLLVGNVVSAACAVLVLGSLIRFLIRQTAMPDSGP